MSTITKQSSPSSGKKSKAVSKKAPLLLKTEEEVSAYLAQHLKPVRRGPKGQPIYAQRDIEKLNVRLYADA